MTCPSFSDRDRNLREQMMGPPTASQHLRASVRRDTDMRWSLLPVEPVKAPRRYHWMIAIPAFGLVLIVLATMGVLS